MEWVKNLLAWASRLVFFGFVFLLVARPFSVYIEPVGLYIPDYMLIIGFSLLGLAWMFLLPFADSCGIGGWMEILSNLCPIELLLMLVFAQYHFWLALALIAALAVLYGLFWWSQRPVSGTRRERRIRHRFFTLASAVLFTVPCVLSLFVYGLDTLHYQPQIELVSRLAAQAEREAGQDAVPADREFLRCFRQKNWETYTREEKLALVQQLADTEAQRLGVPPVEVRAQQEEENSLGHYSESLQNIVVNTDHLDDIAEEVMDTVFHEVYHLYQHYVVNNIDWNSDFSRSAYFATARAWKENQENYIKSDGTEEGYWLYSKQPLEESAREYARERVNETMVLLYETTEDGYILVG